MKKIVLTLAAVSTLGLAACDRSDEANNAAETNTEATANEAGNDLSNAQGAAENMLDDGANALSNGVDAVGNTLEDAGNTIENATD